MSIKIESGLFSLEFADYHAILGVPVDADPKDIRKHYLKLARRLHPDSCARECEQDRQRAAEYLSKLVNPAYEKLSNEKNFSEYIVLLKLKGQQALRQQETIVLTSDTARQLASATGDLDVPYRAALKSLAEKQYEQLDQTLALTGEISELNMVYLMRKVAKGEPPTASAAKPMATSGSTATGGNGRLPSPPPAPPQPAPRSRDSILDSYLRRAQDFEAKQDYTNAIKELRDALKMSPNSANVHTRLGVIYMKTNQATMAKIHFRKALEINPQDLTAKEGLRRVDPEGAKAVAANQNGAAKGSKADPKATKAAPKENKSNASGGLFGLFGKKK
ncbi:MAG TPA: DnaJ domain-containing protein [Synechococcales cyanobacterium M55_K2018_004]|nr:DnaJ domain-containing protein [Synechococcales cyanobacterium M55_K2018_004]